jgi:hypothetical protein
MVYTARRTHLTSSTHRLEEVVFILLILMTLHAIILLRLIRGLLNEVVSAVEIT